MPYTISANTRRHAKNERLDLQKDTHDMLSKDQTFLVSPHLKAFALTSHLWSG